MRKKWWSDPELLKVVARSLTLHHTVPLEINAIVKWVATSKDGFFDVSTNVSNFMVWIFMDHLIIFKESLPKNCV